MIGVGIDQLGELAKMARDEVKMQSVMLEVIETKMDDVHERVLSVNEKLKNTLEEVIPILIVNLLFTFDVIFLVFMCINYMNISLRLLCLLACLLAATPAIVLMNCHRLCYVLCVLYVCT